VLLWSSPSDSLGSRLLDLVDCSSVLSLWRLSRAGCSITGHDSTADLQRLAWLNGSWATVPLPGGRAKHTYRSLFSDDKATCILDTETHRSGRMALNRQEAATFVPTWKLLCRCESQGDGVFNGCSMCCFNSHMVCCRVQASRVSRLLTLWQSSLSEAARGQGCHCLHAFETRWTPAACACM
jgi:hypothetical protein